jgi:hypothetical protein
LGNFRWLVDVQAVGKALFDVEKLGRFNGGSDSQVKLGEFLP